MSGKVNLMRKLMLENANFSWAFCYARNDKKTEATFKKVFPEAYEKINNGEILIPEKDLIKAHQERM